MAIRASLLLAAVLLTGPALPARADDAKVEFKASSTMREMLAAYTGKRVMLRVDGTDYEGTLVMVGEQVAQLSKLAGRDFYDAFIRLDSIQAVVVKAR